MTWGFFKKLVVADRLAVLVDHVYADPTRYAGLPLLVATVFFSYQIYCDFSGYSDIATGAARVMGIRLVTNFDRPYAATSVAEFWRRWHISLSTWFRDYVYIPLGGRRVGGVRRARNVMVTFVISGLWHGASWTFVVWGALHGIVVALSTLAERGARPSAPDPESGGGGVRRALRVASTFAFVTVAWIFFRAHSLSDATYVVTHLLTGIPRLLLDPGQIPGALAGLGLGREEFGIAVLAIAAVEVTEAIQARLARAPLTLRLPSRWAVYYAMLLSILLYGHFRESRFIYFQF
jgi:D-alanyl-lipoteichoic acid acyltransferase DltB (MBOAT superfamily)